LISEGIASAGDGLDAADDERKKCKASLTKTGMLLLYAKE
jgi:hypothetical protein